MKQFLIAILFCLLFISCFQKNEKPTHSLLQSKGTVLITKTKVGFNIYSNQGALILEYTNRNCDSLSLQTLDDIYETALEFNNKELLKEKIDTTQMKVISYVRK